MKPCLVGIVIVIGIAPAAFAQAPPPEVDPVKARQKISMMESVLESAVANGADSLMRQVRAVMPPDALMMTGAPSVRGGLGWLERRSSFGPLRALNTAAVVVVTAKPASGSEVVPTWRRPSRLRGN